MRYARRSIPFKLLPLDGTRVRALHESKGRNSPSTARRPQLSPARLGERETNMYARPTQIRFRGLAICAVSAFVGASAVLAAEGRSPSDAQTRYRQDRAMCESGQSHQDRATCLREAGAALDEAKRGRLNDGQAQYRQNALIRCDALPTEERNACQARMEGQGVTRGSVAEGGIYRELVTRETPSQ
jgi:hypothetical protein